MRTETKVASYFLTAQLITKDNSVCNDFTYINKISHTITYKALDHITCRLPTHETTGTVGGNDIQCVIKYRQAETLMRT